MKSLGLNIIGLSDFHGDLHANAPGLVRFKDQKDYREATRRASDADFLVTPWEEPSAFFGGHYNIMFPRNVYWSKVRQPGQPFTETDLVTAHVVARRIASVLKHTTLSLGAERTRLGPIVALAAFRPRDTVETLVARTVERMVAAE